MSKSSTVAVKSAWLPGRTLQMIKHQQASDTTLNLTLMSLGLLRAGRQFTTVLRITTTSTLTKNSRNASSGTAPVEKKEEQHGDIAAQPVRDVMVADVISGAPGLFDITFHCTKKFTGFS